MCFHKEDVKKDVKKDIKKDVKKDIKKDIKKDVKKDIKEDIKKDIKEDIKHDITPFFEKWNNGSIDIYRDDYKYIDPNMNIFINKVPFIILSSILVSGISCYYIFL